MPTDFSKAPAGNESSRVHSIGTQVIGLVSGERYNG